MVREFGVPFDPRTSALPDTLSNGPQGPGGFMHHSICAKPIPLGNARACGIARVVSAWLEDGPAILHGGNFVYGRLGYLAWPRMFGFRLAQENERIMRDIVVATFPCDALSVTRVKSEIRLWGDDSITVPLP